jgi:CBS domain-containing protein
VPENKAKNLDELRSISMNHLQVWELTAYQPALMVDGSAKTRDVAARFLTSGTDVLAVTDAAGHLRGVITESAVVRALLSNPSELCSIEPYIHTSAESVREDAEISTVLGLFRVSCHSAIPVIDRDQRVCGLLYRQAVMAEFLKHLSAAADSQESSSDRNRNGRIDDGRPLPGAGLRPIAEPTAEASPITHSKQQEMSKEPGQRQQQFRRDDAGSGEKTSFNQTPSAQSRQPNDGRDQRPHFLSGDDARRKLRTVDDWRMGSHESPW